MVIIYLDLETYSPEELPQFTDRIIAIGYVEVGEGSVFLREWESGEESILREFYKYLQRKVQTERAVQIRGFNTLRYDIPLLTARLSHHGIDILENVLGLFHKIFIVDMRQCLLPFTAFKFKGLRGETLSEKLGIKGPRHSEGNS